MKLILTKHFILTEKKKALTIVGTVVLASLVAILFNLWIKYFVDWLVDAKDYSSNSLFFYILGFALIRGGIPILNGIRESLVGSYVESLESGFKNSFFERLFFVPQQRIHNYKGGAVSRTINAVTIALRNSIRAVFTNLLPIGIDIVIGLAVVYALFGINIFLFVLIGVLTYGAVAFYLTNVRLPLLRSIADSDKKFQSEFMDLFINMESIRSWKITDRALSSIAGKVFSLKSFQATLRISIFKHNILLGSVISIIIFAILYPASIKLSSGELSIGSFIMLVTLLAQLFMPLNSIAFAYRQLVNGEVEFQKANKFLPTEFGVDSNASGLVESFKTLTIRDYRGGCIKKAIPSV